MTTPRARRAAIGLWVALALLALVGATAYGMTFAVADTTAWVEHTHEVMEHLGAERAALAEAESLRRAHGLSGDAALLELYADAIGRVRANGKAVRALTLDNANQQRRLDQLEPLIAERISIGDAAIDRKIRDADSAELESEQLATVKELDARIFSALSDGVNEELRLLALRPHRTAESVQSVQLFQAFGTIVSLVILLLAFNQLRRETALRVHSEQLARESEERLVTTLMSIGAP